jgi:pyridoxal phosphate enzyme (YggS family)
LTAVADIASDIVRRIGLAAERAGREPSEVRLIAVTKTIAPETIKEALGAGLRTFGENRVQEALAKARELQGLGIEWHMIGHLQKNKAKAAVGIFEMIHSVDSIGLMELLDSHARRLGKVQKALIQVKLAPEDISKHGTGEKEVRGLLRAADGMKNLRVEGLMTMPPFFDDPERARPYFKMLKTLADEYGLKELSMGMTGDFEVAVEEGATMVRIGSAIFGERPE